MASKWYVKLYTRDILESYDYQKMSLEEKGLYSHLLYLLGNNETGEIEFDEKVLARSVGCSVKKFRAVFAKISAKFQLCKIDINSTKIQNTRMKKEVLARVELSKNNSVYGALGGKAKQANALANAKRTLSQQEQEQEQEQEIVIKQEERKVKEADDDEEFAAEAAQPQQPISSKASKAKKADCPYAEIVALYHQTLPDSPRVKELTPTRKAQIRHLWQTHLTSLERWKKYFEFISKSELLSGRKVTEGHNSKIFNLEWFTKNSNFVNICEQKYHDTRKDDSNGNERKNCDI